MVASTDRKVSKSAFLTDHFEKNKTGNFKSVNEAWTAAGHSGSISQTLVNKLRSELGLVGNLRGATGLPKGSKAKTPTAPRGRPKLTSNAVDSAPARFATNGNHAASPSKATTVPKASTTGTERVLAEVESEIDGLIFKLMGVGGMEKVEEALRTVRRVVVRSHKG